MQPSASIQVYVCVLEMELDNYYQQTLSIFI